MERENLLSAIEQAEMPFAWRRRFRTEREYLRRRSWNEKYYEPLDLASEGEPGVFAQDQLVLRGFEEDMLVYNRR